MQIYTPWFWPVQTGTDLSLLAAQTQQERVLCWAPPGKQTFISHMYWTCNLREVTSLMPHEPTVPGTRSESLCHWLWKLTDPSPNQWGIRSLNPRYSGWTSGRHWWRLHPKPCNSYSSSRCHMTQWRQHIITWPRATYNTEHPPLVHTTPLVSQGHGHRAVLAEAEVGAVVMVVRSDPSNPHTGRVLTREYSDRMIVLQETTWGWVKAVYTDKNYNQSLWEQQSSHKNYNCNDANQNPSTLKCALQLCSVKVTVILVVCDFIYYYRFYYSYYTYC